MSTTKLVKKKDKEKLNIEDVLLNVVDDFYVGTDGNYNIILYKKRIVKSSKEQENIGKEVYDVIGYYSNLYTLYRSLCNKVAVSNLESLFFKNAELIFEKMNEAEVNLKKYGDLLRIKE